jgi:hypothetical protein
VASKKSIIVDWRITKIILHYLVMPFLLTLCNIWIVELPHFGTSFSSFISLHICLKNEYINNLSSTSSTCKFLVIRLIKVAFQASNITFKIFLQFLVKLYERNVIKLCLKGGACWLWQTRDTIHNYMLRRFGAWIVYLSGWKWTR